MLVPIRDRRHCHVCRNRSDESQHWPTYHIWGVERSESSCLRMVWGLVRGSTCGGQYFRSNKVRAMKGPLPSMDQSRVFLLFVKSKRYNFMRLRMLKERLLVMRSSSNKLGGSKSRQFGVAIIFCASLSLMSVETLSQPVEFNLTDNSVKWWSIWFFQRGMRLSKPGWFITVVGVEAAKNIFILPGWLWVWIGLRLDILK